MPNQNYIEPREELKMANCDLSVSYANCKTEDKMCKFTYSSWCPTCDKESPRRRTKSETNEPCRKKGKEMKSVTPKRYDQNQEYENMDLDYDAKDIRFDNTRIRSNLCELPTTYITNNCQMTKLSNYPLDLIEGTDKGIKTYDNSFRTSDCNNHFQNFDNMVEKPERGSKLYTKTEDVAKNYNGAFQKLSPSKIDYIKPHFTTPTVDYLRSKRNANLNTFSVPINYEMPRTASKPKPNDSVYVLNPLEKFHHHERLNNGGLRNSTYEKVKEKLLASEKKSYKDDFKSDHKTSYKNNLSTRYQPNSYNCNVVDLKFDEVNDNPSLCQDNRSIFDKHFDAATLKEKYSREVELLRSKLRKLKGETYDNHLETTHSAPKPSTNIHMDLNKLRPLSHNGAIPRNPIYTRIHNAVPSGSAEQIKTKKAVETLRPPKVEKIKNGSKVSLKTRSKLSAVKLRKNKKIPHSLSSGSEFTDTDCSGSEDSDHELANELEESESLSEISPVTSAKEITPTPISRQSGAGDAIEWLVRPSLFPHIPPYLKFRSFEDPPVKLATARRYLKWKLSNITPVIVRTTLMNSGFRLVRSEFSRESNEWIGTWGKHMKSPLFKTLKETQKLNHFPGTFQVGRKDRLWRNLQRLMIKHGHREFGFIPQTFVLPQDLKLLKQVWQHKDGSANETWIIKPPASARGTGIKVINKWSQLPKRMSLVVQQYISNPYLINGSKFDLRLYVLVTSFNPLRIYLYPDGLVRFASVKYSDDAKDLKDRYMHLTNYSINKLSSQYTANEDANACQGHKWTISKLWEYMGKRGVDTRALWRNLQQLVIKTLISGESSIVPLCKENINNRYNCYELFGIDVLLDERLKPWLLEVNISPSLHSQSPLDAHVKGPLVQSLFNLAQFHLPPRLSRSDNSPPCFEPKIYTTTLTKKERYKHNFFNSLETREEYLKDIINELTGDDVRHLTQAEDELTVIGKFQRIFPTSHTHKYFEFMEVRYYNRLFDGWENMFEKDRRLGIRTLQSMCEQKIHLKVAPPSTMVKNSPSTNLGELSLQPSKEGQSFPEPQVYPPPIESHLLLDDARPKTAPTKISTNLQALYQNLRTQTQIENMVLKPLPRCNCVTEV